MLHPASASPATRAKGRERGRARYQAGITATRPFVPSKIAVRGRHGGGRRAAAGPHRRAHLSHPPPSLWPCGGRAPARRGGLRSGRSDEAQGGSGRDHVTTA
eukprot:scaffold1628_cov407-Prasinococcus_capsulatus_cf.AAC.13